MKFTIFVGAVCDIGLHKSGNEDMILLNNEIFRDGKKQASFNSDKKIIIAVADGVGGLNKGEIASEHVLKALSDVFSKIPDNLENDELKSIFEAYTIQTHVSLSKEMGSTLAGLFFYNGKLFRFHAGDSRIYRLRKGYLQRLTIDHSLREMGGQPNAPSNIITNAIGGGTSAFIDFTEIEHPFLNDDIYLLSSDGLHDLVSGNEISEVLEKTNSRSMEAAEKLTEMANKYGGRDNISVVTINITINSQIED